MFANILMFDELNTAPTRTQAALLEVMQECRATIDGVSHSLPRPFMVIATEVSPKTAIGAYQIMETLADRFFTKVPSYYNLPKEELEIVKKAFAVSDLPVERVTNPQTVLEIVTLLEKLAHLSEVVADCVVRLVTYSGDHEAVLYGPLHRASIHLALLSRACALLNGRDYVMPDDV